MSPVALETCGVFKTLSSNSSFIALQLYQTVGEFVTVVKWCTLLVGFGCCCLVSFHVVLSLRCTLGVPRLCVFICTGEILHPCNFVLKLRFCLWCGCECCFFSPVWFSCFMKCITRFRNSAAVSCNWLLRVDILLIVSAAQLLFMVSWLQVSNSNQAGLMINYLCF